MGSEDFEFYKAYLVDLLVSIDSLIIRLNRSLDQIDEDCSMHVKQSLTKELEAILKVKRTYKEINERRKQ